DSLQAIILSKATDTLRAKACIDLAWQMMQQNPDSVQRLGRLCLSILNNKPNDFLYAKAYNMIAIAQSMQGNLDEALKNYDTCYLIRERMKDTAGIAAVLNNMGNVYRYKGWYDLSLDYFLKSIKIEESQGNLRNISEGYANLGTVYGEIEQLDKALFYFNKAFRMEEESGGGNSTAGLAANMASIYASLGKNDSAIYYGSFSLQQAQKQGDKYNQSVAYAALGFANSNLKKYSEAAGFHETALAIAKEIGDVNGQAQSSMSLGDIYKNSGQYDKAIANCTESILLAKQVESPLILKKCYAILSEVYQQQGNFQKALVYNELFLAMNDSIMSESKQHAMEEMQVKFDTEKKETENRLLQQQNNINSLTISKQRNQIIVLIAGIALLALLGYLFFQYRKNKQQQLHNRHIMEQQELRTRAIIDAEEKERQRIGRELHDGVGQMLAAAKMNLASVAETNASIATELKSKLHNAIDMVDDSAKEIRNISHNMLPNMLIKSGLANAVRELVDKIASSGKLKVELEIVGLEQRLDDNTESFLFRILQELVANTIKHSMADKINMQLIRHVDELVFMMEDNGKGFNYQEALKKNGIGLSNILSRVNYLHGKIDFDAALGRGTTVTITIPL
ncbi:MAG: sensor histidine kinase, partial [Bacteroidetes bacterium]|nr:sensor histidine kinase [Bacteroidota bacterium]